MEMTKKRLKQAYELRKIDNKKKNASIKLRKI